MQAPRALNEHAPAGDSDGFGAWVDSFSSLSDDQFIAVLRAEPYTTDELVAMLSSLILKGRAGVARRMVERGILAPDAANERTGWAAVHLAAAHDAVGLLRFLILEHGVDPSSKTLHGVSPLHLALSNGCEGAAAFLIEEAPGCDLGAAGMLGVRPLMAAASSGMVGIVRTLVEKGADLEAVDQIGGTALSYAIGHKREECALWLLEEGASWRPVCPLTDGSSVGMLEMPADLDCPRVLKWLFQRMRAEGPGAMDDDAAAEAEAAAAAAEVVLKAMERVAEIAAFNGSLAGLKALVEEGLDFKAARVQHDVGSPEGSHDDGMDSPRLPAVVGYGLLTEAAMGGHQRVVEFLIEEGCDPYGGDDDVGMSPHAAAAAAGHTALVEWLIAHYPIPLDGDGGKGGKGHFVLYSAAYRGQMETVRWLIGAGADPRHRCGGRVLPSEIAEHHGHHDVAIYLREEEAAAERRARNEKRRQKKKKGKARQRAAAAAAAAGGGGEGDEEQEEGEEGEAAAGVVAAAGGGGGGMAALDDFDDAAMDFGDADEAEGVAEAEAQGAACASAASLSAALSGLTMDTAPAAATDSVIVAGPPPPPLAELVEGGAPEELVCPLTLQLLVDPVILTGDGITYSRAAIEQHLALCRDRGKPLTSPCTNLVIQPDDSRLVPNVLARGQVLSYRERTAREWEAAMARWREQHEQEQEQGVGEG